MIKLVAFIYCMVEDTVIKTLKSFISFMDIFCQNLVDNESDNNKETESKNDCDIKSIFLCQSKKCNSLRYYSINQKILGIILWLLRLPQYIILQIYNYTTNPIDPYVFCLISIPLHSTLYSVLTLLNDDKLSCYYNLEDDTVKNINSKNQLIVLEGNIKMIRAIKECIEDKDNLHLLKRISEPQLSNIYYFLSSVLPINYNCVSDNELFKTWAYVYKNDDHDSRVVLLLAKILFILEYLKKDLTD